MALKRYARFISSNFRTTLTAQPQFVGVFSMRLVVLLLWVELIVLEGQLTVGQLIAFRY